MNTDLIDFPSFKPPQKSQLSDNQKDSTNNNNSISKVKLPNIPLVLDSNSALDTNSSATINKSNQNNNNEQSNNQPKVNSENANSDMKINNVSSSFSDGLNRTIRKKPPIMPSSSKDIFHSYEGIALTSVGSSDTKISYLSPLKINRSIPNNSKQYIYIHRKSTPSGGLNFSDDSYDSLSQSKSIQNKRRCSL